MFFELVDKITDADRKALADAGVPSPRVSEWKKRKGLPTRPQTLALAVVMGIEFGELDREIAVLETARDASKNEGYARLMKQLRVVSKSLLYCMQQWTEHRPFWSVTRLVF